jgi:hypothetical protein
MTEKTLGTFRKYRDIRIQEDRLILIDAANRVIQEYLKQGLDMTLRQLYYQMVSRWPQECPNEDKFYDKLQSTINAGRLAGLVPWDAIEDRTRRLMGLETHVSPHAAVKGVAGSYKRDLHIGQRFRCEVWVEKEAQLGNVAGVCNELRCDFYASKGYNSQSNQWRAGQRFSDYIRDGQTPVVLYLGDWDPSGVHMAIDNRERLEMFTGQPIMVQRLGLNMQQVIANNPPPNPAKLKTDSRAQQYIDTMNDLGHGDLAHLSWELDSQSPTQIRDLIRAAVMALRDQKEWDIQLQQELEEIRVLEEVADELLEGDEDE